MSEQFPLNFEGDLTKLYREKVGVSARPGRDSDEHLRWAIDHPGEEREQLRMIDLEEDQESRRHNRL
jgi:hypothetical protein